MQQTGPNNKVCYYYSDPRTIYEKLGHAEVVQVALSAQDESAQAAEFRSVQRVCWVCKVGGLQR